MALTFAWMLEGRYPENYRHPLYPLWRSLGPAVSGVKRR